MTDRAQLLQTADFTVGYSFRALSQSLGATAAIFAEAHRCVERGDIHHAAEMAASLRSRLEEALRLHERTMDLYRSVNPDRAPDTVADAEANEPVRMHA